MVVAAEPAASPPPPAPAVGTKVERKPEENAPSGRTRKCVYVIAAMFGTMAISRLIVIPVLIQMLVYTLPIIWFGSHLSLNLRAEQTAQDLISQNDAMLFPIVSSCALGALYLAFKYLPRDLVNLVMGFWVASAGIYSIGGTVAECWKIMSPQTGDTGPVVTLRTPKIFNIKATESKLRLSPANVIGGLVGTAVSLGWFATKSWLLHNLFAIGFSIQGIRLISVGNFKTATLLLTGLFFYDIFWVFRTDVMVTVAKEFNAPAKLLFPVSKDASKMSILGLGDIVVPGLMIAMTLRFDHWRHTQKHALKEDDEEEEMEKPMFRKFSKFYFHTGLIAYAASLLITGIVMLLWKVAQPALLYLVPGLFAALYIPALLRGELGIVLSYNEEEEEEEEEEDEEEDDEDEAESEEAPEDDDEADGTQAMLTETGPLTRHR